MCYLDQKYHCNYYFDLANHRIYVTLIQKITINITLIRQINKYLCSGFYPTGFSLAKYTCEKCFEENINYCYFCIVLFFPLIRFCPIGFFLTRFLTRQSGGAKFRTNICALYSFSLRSGFFPLGFPDKVFNEIVFNVQPK